MAYLCGFEMAWDGGCGVPSYVSLRRACPVPPSHTYRNSIVCELIARGRLSTSPRSFDTESEDTAPFSSYRILFYEANPCRTSDIFRQAQDSGEKKSTASIYYTPAQEARHRPYCIASSCATKSCLPSYSRAKFQIPNVSPCFRPPSISPNRPACWK